MLFRLFNQETYIKLLSGNDLGRVTEEEVDEEKSP